MEFKVPFVRYPRQTIECSGGRTRQSFKDQCDVNQIVNKWRKTGVIDHVSQFQGRYADYGDGADFQAAQERILATTNMFMTLPANIRSKFENDPSQFLDFITNEENLEEMKELGIINEQFVEKVAPSSVEVSGSIESPESEAQLPT